MDNLANKGETCLKPENTCTTYTTELQPVIMGGSNGTSTINNKKTNPIPPIPKVNRFNGEESNLNDQQKTLLGSLNHKYAHIVVGSKHKVMVKKKCSVKGVVTAFEDLSQFPNYFLHEPKLNGQNLGKMFLMWNGKRYYPDGMGFYPKPDKCPKTVFNMFEGIPCNQVDNVPQLFINHIKMVICNNDEVAFKYFMQWLAHMFQKPDEKPSVAIVIKGEMGIGKGTAVSPALKILGPYGVAVTGHEKLTGRFNNLIANRLLVFADEVNLISKKVSDILKGLISEETVAVELKGIDAEIMPNFIRFIFASNDINVIKAGLKERRYLVLEPNPEFIPKKGYFDALYSWLDNGGEEELYDYLLKVDISDFDPRRAPMTNSLLLEKISSLSPAQSFVFHEIKKAIPFKEHTVTLGSDEKVSMDSMQSACSKFVKDNFKDSDEIDSLNIKLGQFLKAMGIEKKGRPDRGSGAYYQLIEPQLLKENFCNYIGAPLNGFDLNLFE